MSRKLVDQEIRYKFNHIVRYSVFKEGHHKDDRIIVLHVSKDTEPPCWATKSLLVPIDTSWQLWHSWSQLQAPCLAKASNPRCYSRWDL